MNKPSNFDNFVDALAAELIAMPDDQVLEGVDVAATESRAQALLKSARTAAGKRRMAAARAGVEANRALSDASSHQAGAVSLDEAKRFIAQAQNDPRFTLAARKLGEMPPEEVLRLYWQMKRLEQVGKDDEA